MSTTRARDEFFYVMGANGVSYRDAKLVLRHATKLQRFAEVACSRELTQAECNREADSRIAIRAAFRGPGTRIVFQGDPRGACVKLKLPGGQANDFGGEGLWCVPAEGYTAKQLDRLTT